MSEIYTSPEQLIGNTPMLRLRNLHDELQYEADVLAKLECFNPGGSVKDRAVMRMLDVYQQGRRLGWHGTIVEPTSGNTGIGLAFLAATRGYRAIIVMPDSMSVERRALIQAYGAEVVLTPGAQGMAGAIDKAKELLEQIPGAITLNQFENWINYEAHYTTTGPEIWEDTEGKLDYFVAGVGTGGTITGVGQFLKEKNPNIKIIAVEPADSPVLSGGKPGPHKLQGIGAGFVPHIYSPEYIDEVMTVTTEDARKTARLLATVEGLLVGYSSGAAMWAALELAKRPENRDKRIVTLLPDRGERYLSTDLFTLEA